MIYHFNQVPIFYEVMGKGPVTVLLHGFLESINMWSRFVAELSENKTIVIIDLPGHGKSGCLGETHTMELMAKVVFSLLKHLKIQTVSMVGHSMGGYVALAFVESHAQKVERLILLNSTTQEDTPERKVNRERAVTIMLKSKKAFINMTIPLLFAESSRSHYSSEIEDLKKEANTFPVEGIKAAVLGMKYRKDRTFVLEKFRREKYIICGDEDPIVPVTISKAIAAATNTKIKILEGGHMSWLENTVEFVKIWFLIELNYI